MDTQTSSPLHTGFSGLSTVTLAATLAWLFATLFPHAGGMPDVASGTFAAILITLAHIAFSKWGLEPLDAVEPPAEPPVAPDAKAALTDPTPPLAVQPADAKVVATATALSQLLRNKTAV